MKGDESTASRKPVGFEATFPLDPGEVSRRTVRHTLGHPFTWLPLTAVLVALAAGGISLVSLPGLVAASLVLLQLRWWWPRCAKRARGRAEEELVRESNRRQDEYLLARMERHRRRGASHGAEILSRLLAAKRRFESGIAREGTHHSTVETMERFGDSICHGVSKEVDALIDLERRLAGVVLSREESPLREHEARRRRCLESIREGYSTLEEGARLVSDSHEPKSIGREERLPRKGVTGTVRREAEADRTMRLSIEGLREEFEVTRGVRNRLAPVPPRALTPLPPDLPAADLTRAVECPALPER